MLEVVNQSPEPERRTGNVLDNTDFGGKVDFCGGRKTEGPGEKPLESDWDQPITAPYEPWLEPGLQWWEARMMTSAPTLLPKHNDVNKTVAFLCVASWFESLFI